MNNGFYKWLIGHVVLGQLTVHLHLQVFHSPLKELLKMFSGESRLETGDRFLQLHFFHG